MPIPTAIRASSPTAVQCCVGPSIPGRGTGKCILLGEELGKGRSARLCGSTNSAGPVGSRRTSAEKGWEWMRSCELCWSWMNLGQLWFCGMRQILQLDKGKSSSKALGTDAQSRTGTSCAHGRGCSELIFRVPNHSLVLWFLAHFFLCSGQQPGEIPSRAGAQSAESPRGAQGPPKAPPEHRAAAARSQDGAVGQGQALLCSSPAQHLHGAPSLSWPWGSLQDPAWSCEAAPWC